MSVSFTTTLAAVLCLSAVSPAAPQQAALTATAHKSAMPSEVAPAVAAALVEAGVRVVSAKGPVTLDFWWVSSLPLAPGSSEVSWADVEEGTLVGAVKLSADYRDVRGREIKAGVYTLRYGIQPANGDHLGVSPYREFLMLSPAAIDTDPAPRGHDGTV
jgi:hypothetical protein